MNQKLYQAELMEHYKNSQFRGMIENPDFFSSDHNPSCGDKIAFSGMVENSTITRIMFHGNGCVLSQAAASLLAEHLLGKKINSINSISKDDMIQLIGLELGPNRLKCILLSLDVLKMALSKYST